MPHTRFKSVNFGPRKTGLATVGYTIAGQARVALGALAEQATGSGIYGAAISIPNGYQGSLVWDTGETTPTWAAEDINPGTDEYLDAPVSGIANQVWTAPSRTLSSFAFSVPVAGGVTVSAFAEGTVPANWSALLVTSTGLVAFDGTRQPLVRIQDGVTAPTYDDCLIGAWVEAYGDEFEDPTALTYDKNGPGSTGRLKHFALGVDANGDVISRHQ